MKNSRLLVLGLLLVLLGSFAASRLQSGNGAIEVVDVVIAGKNGARLSALMFIPKGVSDRAPAPAVVIAHGYVNQKEVMTNFSLEFARRGYVVLAPDLSGHGGSQVIPGDGSRGVGDMLRYVHGLPFVDRNNVGLLGHSMGGWSVITAAMENRGMARTVVVAGSSQGGHEAGFMLGAPTIPMDAGFNFGVEFGKYDEFVGINYFDRKKAADFVDSHWLKGPFGTEERVVLGRAYGDFANGTGRIATQSAETHAGVHQSGTAIANVLRMFQLSSPAPLAMDPMDQVWPYKEAASLVAYVGLILFMLGLLIRLLATAPFAAIVQPASARKAQSPWVYAVCVTLVITAVALLLVPLQMWAMHHLGVSETFPLMFANTSIVYFGAIQAGFLGLFVLWHFLVGRKRGETLLSYGLSTHPTVMAFSWRYLARALALAAITVAGGYALLAWVYGFWHVDVRWWMLLIRPMEPHRLVTALVYVIPFTAIFFVNNLLAFGWLRLKDFGSDLRNNLFWTLALFGVNALGVVLVISAQMGSLYLTGQPYIGEVGYDTLMVILGNGYLPLFAVTSVVSTYCYRRTGNVYTGSLLCGLLATWMIVCYQPY
ncbi:alpha/beta hydrolase [Pseudomonas paralcaligenes]|uniref:alpha/beta hydrolase n=1 Tax=Pseudomonas paralcaligenes TaxID=2772558 RepID=UPI001C7F6A95|nr:alpha/beta fold hydrolase [Pseudomonas paralcaligenes]